VLQINSRVSPVVTVCGKWGRDELIFAGVASHCDFVETDSSRASRVFGSSRPQDRDIFPSVLSWISETRAFPPFCFFFSPSCIPVLLSQVLPSLFPYYAIISGTWRRAAQAGWGIASRAPCARSAKLLKQTSAERGGGRVDVPADSRARVNSMW
jgi:hypothetical protein